MHSLLTLPIGTKLRLKKEHEMMPSNKPGDIFTVIGDEDDCNVCVDKNSNIVKIEPSYNQFDEYFEIVSTDIENGE